MGKTVSRFKRQSKNAKVDDKGIGAERGAITNEII